MADDPFGSLVNQCKPTSSQEDRLRTCPFALESEVFREDESACSVVPNYTPVDPTGIIMVSLPDSSKEDSTPHEDFHTPPEDSLLDSSEEQRTTTAVDALAGQEINGGNDGLDGGETVAVDEGCTGGETMVDLGKDSENLGFSGVKLTQVIAGGGDGVSCIDCSSGVEVHVREVSEDELKKSSVLQSELYESLSTELKISEKNLGLESPEVCVGNKELTTVENRYENVGTEVVESEFEEVGEGQGLDEDTMNVDLPLKETEEGVGLSKAKVSKNGEGGSASKNIEDIDKFKYVSSSFSGADGRGKDRGAGAKRALPSSISGQAGELGSDSLSAKDQKDLLDALKMVAGQLDDGSGDDDFLETAKRGGMTFPQPRWWPPEGFDD